jgi:hypothetical protein
MAVPAKNSTSKLMWAVLCLLAGDCAHAAVFTQPTSSRPLALTLDSSFLWVVSADNNSVYVINATPT